MQHVLILTKNALSEESLIRQLHYLNYEVLCSTDLLQHLLYGKTSAVFSYFQSVILSETLSNHEVEKILPALNSFQVAILRNSETYPIVEQEGWQERGIHEWISKNGTMEDLREALAQSSMIISEQRMSNNQILAFPRNEGEAALSLADSIFKSLSKKEKKVFEKLLSAQTMDRIVSRKEICDYLWRDGETPSNMSQLSCLINKIKRKFEKAGVTDEIIVTQWGRGYKLNEKFCERWLNEEAGIIEFPQSVIN